MEQINNLNFILHMYSGNAKVARVPSNFIIPDAVTKILNYFQIVDLDHQFYTSFEIEYKGTIIHREKLI